MKESVKPAYFDFIESLKEDLDEIKYPIITNEISIPEEELNS